MASEFRRVSMEDVLHPSHLNQYADYLERKERDTPPTVTGLVALAATASVSAKPISRRSLLFPWRMEKGGAS